MKPAPCTHKYMYQLDDRSADILVRYTHQIIEGVDVVTITGIEADPEAIAVIKDDMASKDNDHLIKDLADDLVFSATFRWTERIELRVDPAFAQVATQVFEWEVGGRGLARVAQPGRAPSGRRSQVQILPREQRDGRRSKAHHTSLGLPSLAHSSPPMQHCNGKPEYVGACCNPECDAGPIIVPVEVEND